MDEKNDIKDEDEIMTTQEVAVMLRFHEITILKFAANGTIPACRIGKRKWRYRRKDIEAFLQGEGGEDE